ncbi:hypothetical protein DY052_06380 [Apilactobacillus timberlakei]|uniref:hypothetical protein n=1 Tax=Apilactobacillus timberlakei TaxID=2008380 RepID=UPI00112950E0|nr:hypothetical protein [Apilactobacillus timberlakei]TPR15051.1 hypothetical protein DY052_06380 [Apilactobacillus timberlakei]
MSKENSKLNFKIEKLQMNIIIGFGVYMFLCTHMNFLYNFNFVISSLASVILLTLAIRRQKIINIQLKSRHNQDNSNYMGYNKLQLIANNYVGVFFSVGTTAYLSKPFLAFNVDMVSLMQFITLCLMCIATLMLLYVIMGDHRSLQR